MLRFAKSAPYIPDPARSRPLISEQDRARAALDPPEVVPFQCKPWMEGQAVGWTLFYGYVTPVTIVGQGGGRISVENLDGLAGETNQPRAIDQFARDHFGLAAGYTLRTEPGHVCLILPATHAPPGLEIVIGVLETDWYPRQLFLVFRAPPAGVRIPLEHGAELGRVVVIPRQEDLAVVQMTEAELAEIKNRQAEYLAEEKNTTTRWTAASGETFTHLYKDWSRRFRADLESQD